MVTFKHLIRAYMMVARLPDLEDNAFEFGCGVEAETCGLKCSFHKLVLVDKLMFKIRIDL